MSLNDAIAAWIVEHGVFILFGSAIVIFVAAWWKDSKV